MIGQFSNLQHTQLGIKDGSQAPRYRIENSTGTIFYTGALKCILIRINPLPVSPFIEGNKNPCQN